MDDRMFQQFTYTQHVSAIYLYPACQSSRTSCSPTTIWSNTTSLTSLLQKTWWQRKFLCFNKEQSKEFIEPLDLLSSLWAHLLHPDHQAVPLSFQVTFCLSCIKKAFISGLQSFCAVSWKEIWSANQDASSSPIKMFKSCFTYRTRFKLSFIHSLENRSSFYVKCRYDRNEQDMILTL